MNDFISRNTASYHENLIESLKDIQKAEAYLKVALEGYTEVFANTRTILLEDDIQYPM
jgi:hypothetical protein